MPGRLAYTSVPGPRMLVSFFMTNTSVLLSGEIAIFAIVGTSRDMRYMLVRFRSTCLPPSKSKM